MSAHVAYGISWVRGRIRAAAVAYTTGPATPDLSCHVQTMPQLVAMLDP